MKIERPEDDFYETPEYATLELLKREKFEGSILEPACGYGAISKLLKEHGYEVYSTDIKYRGYGSGWEIDFLKQRIERRYSQNIITNPPFKLAQQFVERALDCAEYKVAMFLRLAFLEGQARKEFFERTPLQYVYVFSKRLTMYPAYVKEEDKKGSGTMATAWFVWNKQFNGEPTIRWI